MENNFTINPDNQSVEVETLEVKNITQELAELYKERDDFIAEQKDYMNKLLKDRTAIDIRIIQEYIAKYEDDNFDILTVPEEYRNAVRILKQIDMGTKERDAEIDTLEKEMDIN